MSGSSYHLSMDNVSSKVSRVIKWTQKGNKERADRAIDRALELFVFIIEQRCKSIMMVL